MEILSDGTSIGVPGAQQDVANVGNPVVMPLMHKKKKVQIPQILDLSATASKRNKRLQSSRTDLPQPLILKNGYALDLSLFQDYDFTPFLYRGEDVDCLLNKSFEILNSSGYSPWDFATKCGDYCFSRVDPDRDISLILQCDSQHRLLIGVMLGNRHILRSNYQTFRKQLYSDYNSDFANLLPVLGLYESYLRLISL